MAIPVLYRSDDASAPVINGTAGVLLAALDAILVNGYGAKPAAGWTKAWSGTNTAAYRQGSGNEYYLRVDDTDSQMGRVVGYKTMSDVDTGTEPFPTAVQMSGGLYLRKSTTADSTARPWLCVATDQTFYLIVLSSAASFSAYNGSGSVHLGYGQFASVTAGDANNGFLIASNDSSTSATSASAARECLGAVSTSATQPTHYVAGSYSQAAGALQVLKTASGAFRQTSYSGDALAISFPDVNYGGLVLYRFSVMQSSSIFRGVLPGLRGCAQPYSGAAFGRSRFATVRGHGAMSAARLVACQCFVAEFFIDLGDWDG